MSMKEVKDSFMKIYIYIQEKKYIETSSFFLQKLGFPKRYRELVSHFL